MACSDVGASGEQEHIRVEVYHIAGRLVSRLHDGFLPADTQKNLLFSGENLPSGMYFVRVETQLGARTSRLVIVR